MKLFFVTRLGLSFGNTAERNILASWGIGVDFLLTGWSNYCIYMLRHILKVYTAGRAFDECNLKVSWVV